MVSVCPDKLADTARGVNPFFETFFDFFEQTCQTTVAWAVFALKTSMKAT
tara:strand:- start:123 stop:272 length:150 start_codon:yes stop_codon:yes gene_type:complete